MPIIANHHAKDDWRPRRAWPDDCYVQWGSRGLVVSRTAPSRTTAFFEAFPKSGVPGFIRGEGTTVEEAENGAFDQFQRSAECEHAWSRRGYRNRGGICRCCNAFAMIFEPVVELGSWRKPLSNTDLDMISIGGLRPRADDDAASVRYRRRLVLRARLAGLDLPDPPEPVSERVSEDARQELAYQDACMDAVVSFYAREFRNLSEKRNGHVSAIGALFDHVAVSSIHSEAVRRGLLPAEGDASDSNTDPISAEVPSVSP